MQKNTLAFLSVLLYHLSAAVLRLAFFRASRPGDSFQHIY